MEWNHSRYQVTRGQATLLHQPLRPAAQPCNWYYDNDDDDTQQIWQRDAWLHSNRYPTWNGLTSSLLIPSLKTDSYGNNGSRGNDGMLPQSFHSSGMRQLEDSTELQSFFLPPTPMFINNQGLSSHLLPPSSQSLQQTDQQYGAQLPPKFADFPEEALHYYPPPMPVPVARPSVDFFSEGIPTLHNVHSSAPTLPPTLGALEQAQHSQFQVALNDRECDVNTSVADTSTSSLFDSSLPVAADMDDACPSLQPTRALPIDSFPARPSILGEKYMPPDCLPVIAPRCRLKRGGGLSEPFTQMVLTQEPKFSLDKRKLCCVEECKSQARAFNRCKRHGGSKRCSSSGCTKSVQSRGLCIRHGGGSRCQELGCTRASQSHGRCKMHGGGRPCFVKGCEKKAHLKRLCRRHGGGAKCCVAECDKWAQRQGMCMTHSKVVTAQPSGSAGNPLLYKTPPPLSTVDSSPPPSLHIFGDEVEETQFLAKAWRARRINKRQVAESHDKTALEIAAHEAQTGGSADNSWTLGLLSTTCNTGGGSGASGVANATWCDHFPAQALTTARAKTSALASTDTLLMGNYDRGAHMRMQRAPHHVSQVTTTLPYLPPRIKKASMLTATSNSSNSLNTAPSFHHLLERHNSTNFTSCTADNLPISTGNRQHSSTSNNNSYNNNHGSFLAPFGVPSPLFETNHPQPDFSSNWGSTPRNGSRSSLNANETMPMNSHNLISSSSATSMFASVDSFMPEYDSTLYSPWTAPSGGVGYETIEGQSHQTQPPLYMTPDDELKTEYPQLTEYTQDFNLYLNDTIESGASPTTPLGTSTGPSVMKMNNLVTTESKTNLAENVENETTKDQQLERLLTIAAATAPTGLLVGRDHESSERKSLSTCPIMRLREANDDAHVALPVGKGLPTGSMPSSSGSSRQSFTKDRKIESKHAETPLLGVHLSGQSLVGSALCEAVGLTNPESWANPMSKLPSTSFCAAGRLRSVKRPRTRQCDFPGCQNRARSHQKCKKHGGAHQCVFEGCTKNSQSRGLCIAHGGGSRCKREGCVRAAQSKGLCKSHGGGEFCAVEYCNKKAHLKHLCRTHGGGIRCKFEKCSKWAQRKGWCMAHAKEYAGP